MVGGGQCGRCASEGNAEKSGDGSGEKGIKIRIEGKPSEKEFNQAGDNVYIYLSSSSWNEPHSSPPMLIPEQTPASGVNAVNTS